MQAVAAESGEAAHGGPFPRPLKAGGRRFSLATLAALTLMQSWTTWAAATLQVAEVSAPKDATLVSVPVLFETAADVRVAALQFDISFDPAVLEMAATGGVEAGAAAKTAQKQVSYALQDLGKLRVLIMGMNQETIGGGEVAVLKVTLRPDKRHALDAIQLGGALMSDPNGVRVPEVAVNGGIRLEGAAASAPVTTTARPKAKAPLALTAAVLIGAAVAGGAVWRRRRK